MTLSMHDMAVGSFVPMLESLSEVLRKGAERAESAKLDLVNARLAPDMFTLAQQVQQVRPKGRLIVMNLDPAALGALERVRSTIRILYHGITGYRVKPPKGLGKNVMSNERLCDLLRRSGFDVAGTETIKDAARSSNIPLDYVTAVKV